jgi:hypothetical protein
MAGRAEHVNAAGAVDTLAHAVRAAYRSHACLRCAVAGDALPHRCLALLLSSLLSSIPVVFFYRSHHVEH